MRKGFAGLIAGLAVLGAGAVPAAADPAAEAMLFARDATILRPKRDPGAGPARPAPTLAANGFLSSPPLGPAFQPQPWARPPAAAPAPAARPAVAEAPLPPRAPQRAGANPASPPAAPPAGAVAGADQKPLVIAAVPQTPPKVEPLTDREIVDRANAFFTNLTSLTADFTQIGGDGRRLTGTLYLQRPGKIRFEYDKPATIEVIADGSSVAVRDTKLATQDLYPLSQTPLKFLLKERVNIGQDIKITGIADDGDGVRLSLEDKSTLGGTSKIILFFDHAVQDLTQWRITDAQGFQTTIMLNKVQKGRRIDQAMFVIDYTVVIKDNSNK